MTRVSVTGVVIYLIGQTLRICQRTRLEEIKRRTGWQGREEGLSKCCHWSMFACVVRKECDHKLSWDDLSTAEKRISNPFIIFMGPEQQAREEMSNRQATLYLPK